MHSDVESARAIGVVPRVFVGVVECAERGSFRCSRLPRVGSSCSFDRNVILPYFVTNVRIPSMGGMFERVVGMWIA